MPDGVQRAMTRQVRCAWEVYATTEWGMGAGEAIRAFDNWMDSLAESAIREHAHSIDPVSSRTGRET